MKMTTAFGPRVAPPMNYFGAPQVVFEPDDGTGTGAEKTPEQIAAETAAADEARAAQELADAEAAAAAAEDANKDAKELAKEKAKLLHEVMDKKSKLKDAEKKAADAAAALAAYEGVDPARVKALLKKEADAEAAAAEARGDFDRVKAMMAEEHARDKKALEDRLTEQTSQLAAKDKIIDQLTVGTAFTGSSFISEDLTLTPTKARILYGAHFEVEGSTVVAYDKPAGESGRTKLVDAAGKPLAFDEAFKRIIAADPEKDTLLRVKTKPGAASNSTQKDAPTKPAAGELYGVSRIAAALKLGK